MRAKLKTVGQNVLVVNGKHYDAKTGELLKSSSGGSSIPKHAGTVIDGFSRRPSGAKSVAPAHNIHSKAEKSKTLMRGAVKKPTHNKVHATSHAVSHHPRPVQKQAASPTNKERAVRATSVSKSSLVSKFGPQAYTADVQKNKQPKPVVHVPVKKAPPISEQRVSPSPRAKTYPNPFADAMQNATSHQQISPQRPNRRQRVASKLRISPRMVSAGSMVMAGLLLGGFFVYQNIPNLAMKVAATRSGIEASLPGYKPAGFAMNGPIKYSAGKISIQYRSTTDDRNFAVNQSKSEWNDETLLDNFVARDRRTYQTYQDKGKTIYIYDDNNATWVNDGVWYQIEGASALNSDQLLRIANSL